MVEPIRIQAARQLGRLALLVGLGAAWILVAQELAEPPASLPAWGALLGALGFLLGAGWLGWAWRQAWVFPKALRKAEVLWDEGASPEAVEALLNGALLARGELGYRIHLLRACALLAQGRREEAWTSCVRGELARLPFPLRWWAARVFRSIQGQARDRQLAATIRLMRRLPRMAHPPHLAAAISMHAGTPESRAEALAFLRISVRLGAADPLLLEDAMLAAQSAGDSELAEQALASLLARHQDPRLLWNREAGAAILLQAGKAAEALALTGSVPVVHRNGPEIWALEAAASRRLGDLAGAEAALDQGLEKYPRDFRLWMESHALAMEDRAHRDALADLEEARNCIAEMESAQVHEWNLRRAEFAWWVDGDAATALDYLSKVPPDQHGPQVPPLRLFLQAALGGQEAVLGEVERLEGLDPGNPGLRILRGECLVGLRAWESLAAFLEDLDQETRQLPEFRHLRGILFAQTNRLAEARDELEEAADMDPDNLRYALDAGHACADLGEWERSESHLKHALHLDETCEEALLELSASRLTLHDRAGALRLLRECLLHHPDAKEAQLRLAELESH